MFPFLVPLLPMLQNGFTQCDRVNYCIFLKIPRL